MSPDCSDAGEILPEREGGKYRRVYAYFCVILVWDRPKVMITWL
jgi:hypothetical protein